MRKLSDKIYHSLFFSILIMIGLTSCNEGKSYSDLLEEEEKAVNWYLAQQRVEASVPADSIFLTGQDAPFYRMNSDGTIYMRVINPGDMNNRPVKGQTVYFRFMRVNLKALSEGTEMEEGNNENMDSSLGGLSLVYGNKSLPSTTEWGDGIQVPLNYLGYGCEVDLIVKSIEGRAGDISQCIPYLYKGLKYFKAEY